MQPLLTLLSAVIFYSRIIRSEKGPADGDLRLIHGKDQYSGTLQVYRGYGWGYICDDEWNLKSANVACKVLQMDYAVKAYKKNFFKSPQTHDVKCHGNESDLTECSHSPWGAHNCRMSEHAGVGCYVASPKKVINDWNPLDLELSRELIRKMSIRRIVDFDSKVAPSGHSEDGNIIPLVISFDGVQGGAVCPDKFQPAEANVACRHLKKGNTGLFFKVNGTHLPRKKQV
ncbi:Deleted in malignant brain tumors 1 [Cichlidogyrus casuarinus]|uniref:Deleted in malignant brain tumors 1 n=1 Tax=Cichlidogyrus casuarinus TaxID=1844966 RepID=A0ABD2PR18_9PLAT